MHLLGLLTYGNYAAGNSVNRNDRGFVDHYFVVVNDKRVGRSKVNGNFLCKEV
jgi:NOL1/NOP2/fmu family ribosome biogenesis protein